MVGKVDEYEPGELFVYANGDRWELGQVKRVNNNGSGYFCWYSTGDTAANTPTRCMHKLANAGWSHIEQECEVSVGTGEQRGWWVYSECGVMFDMVGALAVKNEEKPSYCPGCGAKVVDA